LDLFGPVQLNTHRDQQLLKQQAARLSFVQLAGRLMVEAIGGQGARRFADIPIRSTSARRYVDASSLQLSAQEQQIAQLVDKVSRIERSATACS